MPIRLNAQTRHRHYSQPGFSLLEVLVALVIAAMVCGLAFKVIGNASRTAATSQDYQSGLQLADAQLARIALQPEKWLGQHQGTLPPHFYWQAQISHWQSTPDQPTSPDWALYRIDLQLGWTGRAEPPVRLSTLRLSHASARPDTTAAP